MKKVLLFSAIVALLPATAFGQTPQQLQAVQPTVPQPVVTTTTVTTQQAPLQAAPLQAAPLQAAPLQANPQDAVNALEQTLSQQQSPQTVVSSPSSTVPQMSLPDFATTDESTLLKEASKYQAQLAFLSMMSKIEKARLDIERERMKFETDKLKAEEENNKMKAPTGLPPLPAGVSLPPGVDMSSLEGQATLGGPSGYAVSAPTPVVRSTYSFDGQYFAEVMSGDRKTIAKVGTKLPDGARVVAISHGTVVVSVNGKRTTLGVEGPASTGGLSTTSQMTTTTTSPAPQLRTSLPPLPQNGPSNNP